MTAGVSRPRGERDRMAPAESGMRGKAKVAHFLILKSAPPSITMIVGEILSAPNAAQNGSLTTRNRRNNRQTAGNWKFGNLRTNSC